MTWLCLCHHSAHDSFDARQERAQKNLRIIAENTTINFVNPLETNLGNSDLYNFARFVFFFLETLECMAQLEFTWIFDTDKKILFSSFIKAAEFTWIQTKWMENTSKINRRGEKKTNCGIMGQISRKKSWN